MEHSQRLLDLVSKLPKTKSVSSLAVPLSLKIIKKCVEYRVDPALIKHLHFYDLQCLLIQLDIQNIMDYLKSEEKRKLQAHGVREIKDIEGAEVLKFLGR